MKGPRSLVFGAIALLVVTAVIVARSGAQGPAAVSEVPATLSGQGVEIDNTVVLAPLSAPPAHALPAAEAIRTARRYAGKFKAFPPAALEARVTVNGSRQIKNVPAWVVTSTSPKPFTARNVLVTHFSVVLNASTGKLLLGFVTK